MAFRLSPLTLSLSVLLSASFLTCACGGSGSASQSANDADQGPHSDSLGTYPDSGEADEVDLGCDDGTCFPCGEGFCPQGAYCDEDSQDGAACAWLAECSKTPDCACVTQALGSACACDAAQGGPSVSCQ